MIVALRTGVPDVGGSALDLLDAPRPPVETALTALLNDLAAVAGDVVLVLDDYHVIGAGPEGGTPPGPGTVHDGMAFLLDHLPPNLHVVIATGPTRRCRWRGSGRAGT